MNKIKFYLKRIYRLTLSFKKQEEIVWKELKKLHADAEWKSGIYEKEKYIETVFEIGNEQGGLFYYLIYDGSFHCRVKILEDYPTELTTDLFILAAHSSRLIPSRSISRIVSYSSKDIVTISLFPLLSSGRNFLIRGSPHTLLGFCGLDIWHLLFRHMTFI